jgi:glycosyltransferase involved in cell wall biosynthesis
LPIIAIDYTPAYEQSAGIGRYVRELVSALSAHDQETSYRLFVAGAARQSLPPAPGSNFEWKVTRLSPRWLARIWNRLHLPLPVEAFTSRVDLFHATDFVLPPTLRRTRTILQVHDLSFVRVPEAAPPRLKAFLDRVVPASINRADFVLADSQATKDDLIELYAVPSQKVAVLYGGVDQNFSPASDKDILTVRHKYHLNDFPFIFSLGTVQPRKNYGRLIEALAQLRHRHLDVHLVIAGGRGWLEDPIYRTIEAVHMGEYVHFIGFADDADLPALYSAAACFAFPSLYEGFGFPVLEAMACGTPVLTSTLSSLPEVAGDAALIVDPYSTEAIASALERLIEDSDLREQLVRRGLEQAQRFTWSASAETLRRIYYSLLNDTIFV